MSDLWGTLAALAAIIVPLALAWWLIGRSERRRQRDPGKERGKMPGRH
ncbi:MAG TPA: hypothetical protein PLX45_21575 [Piscinibacter sp.]|nr:hypothetical protein [Piscinibacter sp.]HOY34809.1 hypothetical protein [Piscinibacter sp.]HPG79297.1 hypothetical protein [Piscinibacter sp.]HPM68867.1 hypothetical protein [Piscinibacter sp.]